VGRWLRVVVGVLVLLLAGGCFQAKQELVVRADGSGTFRLHVVLDLEAFEQIGASIGGAFSDQSTSTPGPTPSTTLPFRVGDRPLPGGGSVNVGRDGSKVVVDATFPFADSVGFDRAIVEVGRALATDGGSDSDLPNPGALTVMRLGDTVEIALRLESATNDSGLDFSSFGSLLREDLKPSYAASITAPGDIRTSNADEVHGATATWDLLRKGAPQTLTLTADAESGIPTWLLTAVGVALLLVLAGLGWTVVRRVDVRTSPAAAAVETPAAPAAPAPPPVPWPPSDPLQSWPDRPQTGSGSATP
jgi:hypothetical protein